MSSAQECALSAATGETRVGVSSATARLSLKLSNNFRDVKFDTNCIAAYDRHLKQSHAITVPSAVANIRYRDKEKRFLTRDRAAYNERGEKGRGPIKLD